MPWYPLYHADFTSDTVGWTPTEVGCLVRLMNYQWANGSVPYDQKKLALICGINDPAWWTEIWSTLKPKFKRLGRTNLLNHRLSLEQDRSLRKSAQSRQAALIRHHGKPTKTNEPDATAHADDMLSTVTYTSTEDKREASPPLPDGLNLKAWGRWLHYRRVTNKPKWKPVTIKAQTKKLIQFTDEQQAECIDHSIENGYSGLFTDKFRGGGSEGGTAERIERATGVKRL
jgi:uncharacterized protein YdaU (DUF1376 family)